MNLFSNPLFSKAGRRAIRIGGIAKNDFAFMNFFVHQYHHSEQIGVKP
jgi:hypothetical protein